jgi:hydrogenase maturation protein HypF
MSRTIRIEARVEGIVQGVGFRPYVHALASRLGLAGRVGNDAAGVFLELEGDRRLVEEFFDVLRRDPPPLAVVEHIHSAVIPPTRSTGFEIAESEGSGERRALISADVATCADCLRELADPGDRRFAYPFINCTNCGPRFTILRGVPYDRPNTTMRGFPMCADCSREYHDPADRRFHAQPVCCPACGPRLALLDGHGGRLPGEPLDEAARLLVDGRVVAVKGIGGYHLAADAGCEPAVATLRGRKHREDKPFAVMVADLTAAREVGVLGPADIRLLTAARRPIVLVARREGAGVAPSVAPRTRQVGIMLPYTPLHHLLLRELARPIVLTSGNISDEPIAYDDADAVARLAPVADAFLSHDRPIHIRVDDSVARTFRGRELLLRRSRGYAPQPFALPCRMPRPVLGCGAGLKSTFCLAKDRHAVVSHHIGDLENYETLRSYIEGIGHFQRLFDVTPEVVAHDLHPDYLSTKYATEVPDVELVGVQHHHAHIASCLADNGEAGPVLGVAFDGTGYGTDGTIWGGEFLVADLVGFTRIGHLRPVPMPGGATAVREPWRMAVSYLDAAYGGEPPSGLDIVERHTDEWHLVARLARQGVGTPATSSAGRLFDAVAAILGIRDRITYEGQAAIELEQLADPREEVGYRVDITEGEPLRVDTAGLMRAVTSDLRHGEPREVISARFHNGVADAVVATCVRLRERTGLGTVALSGGVFQNLTLLGRTVDGLEHRGLRVLTHSRIPPNDGGVSLGQVAVAAARLRDP